MLPLDVIDIRYSQDASELLCRHLHRPRRVSFAWLRLWKRRRCRRVKSHRTFDLLQRLVNVPIQHGYRTEFLQVSQCLSAVLGTPAPFRIHGPQRNVSEHDDRCAGFQVLHVVFQPFELLGPEQLEWLEDDVKHLKSSTPIVVFAHIPLWSVYPEWGWRTEDSAQALAYLKKFCSVTVLNGHIHQTLQKVEGTVTFHTAASTAFPQPQPGKADSPGPMKVPAEQLRSVLGITDVNYVQGQHALAVVDSTLA